MRMGSKTLSLRDNRLKTTKAIGWNLVYTQKKSKIVKISPPLFKAQINKKKSRDLDRNCFYVFCRLSRKLGIFYPICVNSFMFIFDHRISPESLSVEF
jgi:hypothetical protein